MSQEDYFAAFLNAHGIRYTRPDQVGSDPSVLDFHLTDHGLSVELKNYSSPRLHDQLVRSGLDAGPVMVLIGPGAVAAFAGFIAHVVGMA